MCLGKHVLWNSISRRFVIANYFPLVVTYQGFCMHVHTSKYFSNSKYQSSTLIKRRMRVYKVNLFLFLSICDYVYITITYVNVRRLFKPRSIPHSKSTYIGFKWYFATPLIKLEVWFLYLDTLKKTINYLKSFISDICIGWKTIISLSAASQMIKSFLHICSLHLPKNPHIYSSASKYV